MSATNLKLEIQQALRACQTGPLAQPARALLATLGYRSDKRLDLDPNDAAGFREQFDPQGRLNAARALLADWRSVDLLQQITADELGPALNGQGQLFQSQAVDGAAIQSYLFFAIDLAGAVYTRTQLAAATREINKLFPMPAMVLFRHGASLTFAIIARRVHRRDASRDVLEKVTLIRDIRCAGPHRAHLEILADLALPNLAARHTVVNFADLQRAWEKTLDTSELNKKFFHEVANWYFWAVQQVVFPGGAGADPEMRNAVSVIRLITRLIFVWFIREKGLAPAELFEQGALRPLLRWNDPKGSTYYKAILQNLFFATLNSEMGAERRFRGKNPTGRDSHYGIPTVYRYENYFADPAAALQLFARIPFLNGGLFECLDRPGEQVRIDGFSDRADNPLTVPDVLFFGDEQEVDLNAVFGTRNRTYRARGLLRIFDSYKFTIEENTPIEEEIALDPELLGKVFENLLAAYNPETNTTARKQTGSFYTPREIVDYMVDESLLAYLETALREGQKVNASDLSERLRGLLAYSDQPHGFDAAETAAVIAAIDRLKCLDPACGSGAFPMGMLHKLVYVLARLDPDNSQWRALQRQKAVRETEEAYTIGDRAERKARLDDIEEAFTNNTSDYGRKLYLIENCIYGVDIQPIAVQIAKLRFFISLVVDQTVEDERPNRGVRPLPNLETKFVAANTLIGIPRPQQMALRDPAIEDKEHALAEVRKRHFAARTQATKEKYRREDQRLRAELAELLRRDGWGRDTAAQLAAWDPYDQNASAGFFDPEWMFGLTEGFDVVIGNPPYVDSESMVRTAPAFRETIARLFSTAKGNWDLYIPFWEMSIRLTSGSGIAALITPNKWLSITYGKALRRFSKHLVWRVADYSKFRAFENTGVFAVVVFMRKDAPKFVEVTSFLDKDEVAYHQRIEAQTVQELDSWGVLLSDKLSLIAKLLKAGRKLSELCTPEEPFTVSEAYLLSDYVHEDKDCTRDSFRFLNTGTIDPYVSLWGRKPTTYLKHKYSRPVISRRELQSILPRRYGQSQDTKIIISGIRHFECFWDQDGEWVAGKSTVILRDFQKGISPVFLLGILNSRLTTFFLRECYGSLSMDGGINFSPSNVSEIPIAGIHSQQDIIGIVEQILVRTRSSEDEIDISSHQAEIDQRVYALYGLTAEEIRIVEGERG